MKVFLMYIDRDFSSPARLPPNEGDLTQDLSLETLFECMSNGSKLLFETAREAILSSAESDLETIRHRQEILKDCLRNRSTVERLHALAGEALERERKDLWWSSSRDPSLRLYAALRAMDIFMAALRELRDIADERAGSFSSAGLVRLLTAVKDELSDDYLASARMHLRELKFEDGALIGARLGEGNKGTSYVFRGAEHSGHGWLQRILDALPTGPAPYTVYIDPQDQNGPTYLSNLKDQGIVLVADALARSRDHIRSFFVMLQRELGFYIGCANLHQALTGKGVAVCFPLPAEAGKWTLSFEGLRDASLALTTAEPVIGNDVDADGKKLMIITGANRGGKSTFLRGAGIAQLMMQAGMFVAAASFRASLCDGVFTHFKREEDPSMKSGKFDEELSRMSLIADRIRPHSMLLFNESFAATNEREGSEIARQIVTALSAHDVKILFVTHLHEFPRRFYEEGEKAAIFLRAERLPDGSRPFKLTQNPPLTTSYGEDLYNRIFRDRPEV